MWTVIFAGKSFVKLSKLSNFPPGKPSTFTGFFYFMANRVIRDWTASETMDVLTPQAEVFFTRLIMKADDYGSFHANIKLIKAALFPLKDHTIKNIESWLNECISAGLIGAYTVDSKKYIQIINFGQRLQNMRSAFPRPNGELEQVTVNHGESLLETKRNETEEETETETNGVTVWPSFDDFWNLYDKKVGKPNAEKRWKKINQGAREKIMQHLELYVRSTPDTKYRKNPDTYLNQESWNDEIIIHGKQGITAAGTLDRLNSYTNG